MLVLHRLGAYVPKIGSLLNELLLYVVVDTIAEPV